MSATKIPWATHTANWLAGCSHCSPACDHCYAEAMSARLAHMGPVRYRGVTGEDRKWTGAVVYDRPALHRAFDGLCNARKPRRVFANSMSDTFHPSAPESSLADLATEIQRVERDQVDFCWPHVLMLLTKRPAGLLAWQREYFPDGLPSWVWAGVTVEDQLRADQRVPKLLEVVAWVRFLSCEPMLGPVDLSRGWQPRQHFSAVLNALDRAEVARLNRQDVALFSWILCGDESGHHRRPADLAWVRSLRDQCIAVGVPFFLKQLHTSGRRIEMPELDGHTWGEVPT